MKPFSPLYELTQITHTSCHLPFRESYGASLEPLAQLVDALGGVGAAALEVEAAEVVAAQAAKLGSRVSMGADRNEHSGAAAHLRSVIFASLRTAASMEAPLGPMSLPARLQGMGEVWG